eukprot:COSAG01_NODE_9623_length_2385_cov_4.412331_1_plen_194_part_10
MGHWSYARRGRLRWKNPCEKSPRAVDWPAPGFTGVSCAPFLSPTILTLFNISAMHLKDTTPTAPELQAVKARFKKVAGFDPSALAGLVIDEISFMQPEVLGRVSRILQGIHDCDKPMGGVVYMLAGHLFQLPPVKAPGTWFLDLLRTVLRDRGDDVGATRARSCPFWCSTFTIRKSRNSSLGERRGQQWRRTCG